MTDREKVIEVLEKAKTIIETWVPMFEQYNTPAGMDDALVLLKEQEEKQIPKQIIFSDDYEEYWGKEEICPTCGKHWMSAEIDTTHFCPGCGRAVKLE